MRPIRIFNGESFRFAALFALVFLTLSGVLIGTVLWIVDGAERNTLMAANEADISTVTNGLRAEGLDEAIEVVQQRLGTLPGAVTNRQRFLPESYMVIQGPAGEVLAGNLGFIPCAPGSFRLSLPARSGRHHAHTVLGRCARLTEAATLFVGRDTSSLYATRERILHAFGWVALGTCAFAIIGGLLLGRRFMAQVDAITQTCERVIAGRLNERIPVRGRSDEWDRLARAINEMLDRISTLLENLQQVSSDIAHDLRTPLTRLRNRLEVAGETSKGIADYSTAIMLAMEDTDQLLLMFSALLRISQIEAGTRVQRFSSLDLSALLETVYQLYLPVAQDCHHSLSRTLHRDLQISGDPELLVQLFSNLIENAIRHTPPGTSIRMASVSVNGEAVASVIDDGPGVPPGDLDKLTRRFYRGSASRSSEGHGLGLSLVAAVAQLHSATLLLADAATGLRVDLSFPQLTQGARAAGGETPAARPSA